MRLVALGCVVLSLAACSTPGPQRLAMGVEVPCDLSGDDMRLLRGRANAMEREERAALNQSLQLVDAAIALGGNVVEGPARALRQSMIDRSNKSLRLQIEMEADVACGFTTRPQPPQPRPETPLPNDRRGVVI